MNEIHDIYVDDYFNFVYITLNNQVYTIVPD